MLDVEDRISAVPEHLGYHFEHEDRDAVAYAIYLLEQRRLVETMENPEMGVHEADSYFHLKLTWEGCDFLDAVRDDEVWRKTKETARAAGGFTFDLLKQLAIGFVKTKIELHTGVDLSD